MENKNCSCGRQLKAPLKCGLCEAVICKSCVEFVAADTFSFMKKVPDELSHTQYCSVCFSGKVLPGKYFYNQVMKRAKDIIILDKPRRKPLPILKKSSEELKVKDCADREETVLRLGFLAAEQGFNAVLRANVAARKVRNYGYQTMVWDGSGFPAELDSVKLEKREED